MFNMFQIPDTWRLEHKTSQFDRVVGMRLRNFAGQQQHLGRLHHVPRLAAPLLPTTMINSQISDRLRAATKSGTQHRKIPSQASIEQNSKCYSQHFCNRFLVIESCLQTLTHKTATQTRRSYTHKSAKTHAGTVFVPRDFDLLTPK